ITGQIDDGYQLLFGKEDLGSLKDSRSPDRRLIVFVQSQATSATVRGDVRPQRLWQRWDFRGVQAYRLLGNALSIEAA
ncbi:MAG: hypothetical protein GY904_27955, partial [Planctomycetaceae bacterium]|nr:hypothetical protein [Planctomycetaceae bacterium]